jgi:hypothetical protein
MPYPFNSSRIYHPHKIQNEIGNEKPNSSVYVCKWHQR